MVAPGPRVAILGGDGRQCGRWGGEGIAVHFMAGRAGGNGEPRRLEAALRSGSITRVVILARWNGHATTRRIRRVCRTLGVPVEVVP
ncbi:hypothetical protein L6R50_08520 [Myxococcota bacterium]|nr:hypothetical protein [Myxococcota bacterium]